MRSPRQDQLNKLLEEPGTNARFRQLFTDLTEVHHYGMNAARVQARKTVLLEKIENAQSLRELNKYLALILDPAIVW